MRLSMPSAFRALCVMFFFVAVGMLQVALHVGPDCWQQLQSAFLDLAVAAVNGDCDVAAALLLSFPDLAAALGHQEAAVILVPVMLELLHTRLVRTFQRCSFCMALMALRASSLSSCSCVRQVRDCHNESRELANHCVSSAPCGLQQRQVLAC
jgi:hypothetical protein